MEAMHLGPSKCQRLRLHTSSSQVARRLQLFQRCQAICRSFSKAMLSKFSGHPRVIQIQQAPASKLPRAAQIAWGQLLEAFVNLPQETSAAGSLVSVMTLDLLSADWRGIRLVEAASF